MSEMPTMATAGLNNLHSPENTFLGAGNPNLMTDTFSDEQEGSSRVLDAALADARAEVESRLTQELPNTIEDKYKLVEGRTAMIHKFRQQELQARANLN